MDVIKRFVLNSTQSSAKLREELFKDLFDLFKKLEGLSKMQQNGSAAQPEPSDSEQQQGI